MTGGRETMRPAALLVLAAPALLTSLAPRPIVAHADTLFSGPPHNVTSAPPWTSPIRRAAGVVLKSQQIGIIAVLIALGIALGIALTFAAGSHLDVLSGARINNFLNAYTLVQMGTDASSFAIMGVGATIVIIAGGIDLSVGAIYALAGSLPRSRIGDVLLIAKNQ